MDGSNVKSASRGAVLLPLFVMAGALLAWTMLSKSGVFPDTAFPSPADVWRGFSEKVRHGLLFDDVVASLVLHYLEDWGPTLAELRRVLKPGGRLIASVDHPFVAYTIQDPRPWRRSRRRRPDYFATTSYSFEWTLNGQSVPMRFWRKPLHAMTDAFTTAGFRLAVISEPQPDPAARELFPDSFHDLSTKPGFLFFVVEVAPSTTGSDS